MQRQLFACALIAGTIVVGTAVSSADAGLILYGDFAGSTVDYLNVNESSDTDPGPLFGAPTVTGDSLTFNNMSFSSSAAGMGGADISTGILNTTIDAHDGNAIHALSFRESGSYTLSGLINDAFAAVAAAVIINVLEVDGMAVDPIGINTLMMYTPSGGSFSIGEDGAGSNLWEGMLDLNLDALLSSRGVTGSATRLSLTITNTLSAASMAETAASISKKSLSIRVVPAPPTALLLLLGAAGSRRRRRVD